MEEVSEAKSSRMKNRKQNTLPSGICRNRLGMVMNSRETPEDGSMPNANALGMTMKPARNATEKSVMESPTFVSGINAFKSHGANVVGIEMDEEGIDLDKLEQAVKREKNVRMLYLIPTFQNPSGKTMGLTNVEIMIPFVRTVDQAKAVVDELARQGLKRGENGLKIIMATRPTRYPSIPVRKRRKTVPPAANCMRA